MNKQAPRHPTYDEMLDALCWAARRIELDSAIPVLRGDRAEVHPERLRRIQCLDAAVVELTRLKHERRNGQGRGFAR
jgi:hypothetical protein